MNLGTFKKLTADLPDNTDIMLMEHDGEAYELKSAGINREYDEDGDEILSQLVIYLDEDC